MRGGTTSYRAGWFGTFNAVLGLLGLVAFGGIVTVTALSITAGRNILWSSVGGTLAVVFAIVSALTAAAGINTWRPVRLRAGPEPIVSVPGFSARRGFYRVGVPLEDVRGVQLAYNPQFRNARWQLVVTRRHGSALRCDSVTSGRSPRADVRATPGGLAVARLREGIRDASRR